MFENLIVYHQRKISTHLHSKCHLLVCLFALSPPEEKKRRRVKELREVLEVLSCRKKRGKEEKQRAVDRRREEEKGEGRGNHMEEPSCDNRSTSMHRCECHECTLVSPVTLPSLNKEIQFYTVFHRSIPIFHSIIFTAVTF